MTQYAKNKLQKDNTSSISDEVKLLSSIANAEAGFELKGKDTWVLIDILTQKYKGDDDTMKRLLMEEIECD